MTKYRTMDHLTLQQQQVIAYCRELGLLEPELEFRFHPTKRWRFDFAWFATGREVWREYGDLTVALEVHGSVHQQGRHTRGPGFERDREKMSVATALGWRVIECSTGQLWKPWVWDCLRRLLIRERRQ